TRQQVPALLQAKGIKYAQRFLRHRVVVLRQCRQLPRFPLVREDRQGNVIQGSKLIKQVDQLKTAGNAGLDTVVDRQERNVTILEEDRAAIRTQQATDEIHQGSFA